MENKMVKIFLKTDDIDDLARRAGDVPEEEKEVSDFLNLCLKRFNDKKETYINRGKLKEAEDMNYSFSVPCDEKVYLYMGLVDNVFDGSSSRIKEQVLMNWKN